jgi:hypothetical protein
MQPIFSRNIDYRRIAFLNWRIEGETPILNMFNIAEGYLEAALQLCVVCVEDNEDKKADILVFPILANANHGIELYLKGINWILNKLTIADRRIEGGHNIKMLYETIRSKLRSYPGNLKVKDFNKALKGLKNYIDELFQRIEATPSNDKMDFARYPISTDYEEHFYVGRIGTVEIDLENFYYRFTDIKEQLDRISKYLYYDELGHEC